jgi:hypothetical protein
MKIEYDEFGGFEIETEDGRDILWARAFAENLSKEGRDTLGDYFEITQVECSPPTCTLQEAVSITKNGEEYCHENIDKIIFSPFKI